MIRLSAIFNGHTYIYSYPPEEAPGIVDIIYADVLKSKIPMLAGRVLTEMVLGGWEDGD